AQLPNLHSVKVNIFTSTIFLPHPCTNLCAKPSTSSSSSKRAIPKQVFKMATHNAPGPTNDKPDIVKTTVKTLTQQEFNDQMDRSLAAMFANPQEISAEFPAKLAADLTPQRVKVLSRYTKIFLGRWATQVGHEECIDWLRDASDDLESVTWEETVRIPGAKLWSPQHPIAKDLDDLEEASRKLKAKDRTLFETKIASIRQFIEWEKERVEHQEFESVVETLENVQSMVARCLKRVKKE
ncbi:hypothetical protein V8C26DRAFT_440050, partial [Trichoderma gracile]